MTHAVDLIAAAAALAFVAGLTLRRPTAGLVATIVLIGAASSAFPSFNDHMTTVRWGALAGLAAGGVFLSRGRPFPWQGSGRPLLLLLAFPAAVGLISAAWSVDPLFTIARSFSFGALLVAVGLIVRRVEPQELARLLVTVAGIVAIASLGLWALDPGRALLGNLLEGVFQNPNALGLALGLMLPFALMTATTRKGALIRWSVVVLLAATIALSGSRNALAAVAIGLLTLAFATRRVRQTAVAGVVVAATVLAVTMIPLKQTSGGLSGYLGVQRLPNAGSPHTTNHPGGPRPSSPERNPPSSPERNPPSSPERNPPSSPERSPPSSPGRSRLTTFLGGRNEAWSAAWRIIEKRPVEGFGFGTGSDRLFSRFPSAVHLVWFQGGGPSNAYLQLMMETGLLGAVFFLAPLGAGVVLGFRRMRRSEGEVWPLVLLAASVTSAMFESTLTSAGAPWALLAWLAVAAILGAPQRGGTTVPVSRAGSRRRR